MAHIYSKENLKTISTTHKDALKAPAYTSLLWRYGNHLLKTKPDKSLRVFKLIPKKWLCQLTNQAGDNYLLLAAGHGKYDMLEHAFEVGGDINQISHNGNFLFQFIGNTRIFIEKPTSNTSNQKNNKGVLNQYAEEMEKLEKVIFNKIKNAGFDFIRRDEQGQNQFFAILKQHQPVGTQRKATLFEWTNEHYPTLLKERDTDGNTLLIKAALNHLELLSSQDHWTDWGPYEGLKPSYASNYIEFLSLREHSDNVLWSLARHCPVEAINKQGQSVLHLLCEYSIKLSPPSHNDREKVLHFGATVAQLFPGSPAFLQKNSKGETFYDIVSDCFRDESRKNMQLIKTATIQAQENRLRHIAQDTITTQKIKI